MDLHTGIALQAGWVPGISSAHPGSAFPSRRYNMHVVVYSLHSRHMFVLVVLSVTDIIADSMRNQAWVLGTL